MLRVGNVIRGPGGRAPRYTVLAMTTKQLVVVDQYQEIKTFSRKMDHVWTIVR